jgi:hypothetical protein
MEHQLIGIGNVSRGDRVVLEGAVYRLSLTSGGRVTGGIKAPSTARLCHLAVPGPRLHLTLEDGSGVSFFVFRAQTAPGGWGDVEGRMAPGEGGSIGVDGRDQC